MTACIHGGQAQFLRTSAVIAGFAGMALTGVGTVTGIRVLAKGGSILGHTSMGVSVGSDLSKGNIGQGLTKAGYISRQAVPIGM